MYNILVVEDVLTNVYTLFKFNQLHNFPYYIESVAKVNDAIYALHKTQFDLILIDYHLLDGDCGVDVAKHIDAYFPEQKYFFISSLTDLDLSKCKVKKNLGKNLTLQFFASISQLL